MKIKGREDTEAIRECLLALGVKQQRIRMRAGQEYMATGNEEARRALVEASLLLHGVCQLAEVMGISSYCLFEAEICGME